MYVCVEIPGGGVGTGPSVVEGSQGEGDVGGVSGGEEMRDDLGDVVVFLEARYPGFVRGEEGGALWTGEREVS